MRRAVVAVAILAACAVAQIKMTGGARATRLRSGSVATELLPGINYGIKNDLTVYSAYPTLPTLPAGGGTFTDPTFGTPIMRLTDSSDERFCYVIYSNVAAFNSDGTKIFVHCNRAPGSYETDYIYDFNPATFTRGTRHSITRLMPNGGYLSWQTVRWSYSDPTVFYALSGTDSKLYSYDTDTDSYTQIHDFASHLPAGATKVDRYAVSAEGSIVGVSFSDAGANNYLRHLVKNVVTNTVLYSRDTCEVKALEKSVYMSRDGRYFGSSCSNSVEADENKSVFDLQNGASQRLVRVSEPAGLSHEDWGTTLGVGRGRNNHMVSFELGGATGQYTDLLSGFAWMGTHTSMRQSHEHWYLNGWFDCDGTTGCVGDVPTSPVRLFAQELIAIDNEHPGNFVRLAHHRSLYGATVYAQSMGYWCTPRASVSQDGRFIVWNSNWENQGNSDWTNWRLDVFVARLR